MQLTSDHRARIGAAAAVLAAGHDHDALSLAARVGSLEWQLEEMLRIIRDLAR